MEHTKILTAVGNTGHVYMLEKLPGYDGTGFAAHMMTWVARHPEMMDNVDDYLRLMREALEGGKAYGVRYIQK